MFAQVVVDVTAERVDRPFTYRVPDALTDRVVEGARVLVPFGPRRVSGIVVALSDAPDECVPEARIRAIDAVPEEGPAVTPPLMRLARKLAEDNRCALAETLRLMIPSGLRAGRVRVRMEETARLCGGAEAIAQAKRDAARAPKRATLLTLLSDGEPHAITELSQSVREPRESLRKLAAAGVVLLEKRAAYRLPVQDASVPLESPPDLQPEQRDALSLMLPALERGEGRFLLHGVTGSGKTEVYMALIRRARALGRDAIVLVPEIALTPQMVRWFCARFGAEVAVLHSRLSEGERLDEWRRIREGGAHVVVGARSAVFAPVGRLGLIVVDEEHEQTYLSDRYPRYDARDVAAFRTSGEGALLLLSSATPSILSFFRARRGDYTLVEMPHRVMNRPLPSVEIVDMRAELAEGNRSIFSVALMDKLRDRLSRGEQAMLFLNRRGYSSFVSCRACGYVARCDNCDIAMTYHQPDGANGVLRCHLCGLEKAPPAVCPECGSRYIRYFGVGTQKVEEELRKLFPQVRSVRMDIDTTSMRGAHARLLETFRSGEAQVLIGTQMIAKGLDFPRVTLVGVIAADLTLNLPDYRAPERTFQLITQVAGRAGRADATGEVVVQTYKPDDPVLLDAARQDYRAFFERELERRRRGLHPPFTLLGRLLVEADDPLAAKQVCEQLYTACIAFLKDHPAAKQRVLLLRADEAPVKRIRGKTRYHVLFKLFRHAGAREMLDFMTALSQTPQESAVVTLEINPASLM